MAIENVQSAALAYQGSKPAAAAPVPKKQTVIQMPQKAVEEDVGKTDAGKISDGQIAGSVADAGAAAEREKDNGVSASAQQNNKKLQEAVEKLRKNMNDNTEAVFGIHDGTNRIMIKIVDKNTKDVIKEYPPEKTLDMIQKVWEMAGIMVDEKR